MTSEIEMAVVEEAEPEEDDEAVVAARMPSEHAAPAEPTTTAGDSVEPPAGKDDPALVQGMVDRVEDEEPGAVDDVAAVLTTDIEAKFAEDAEYERDPLVVKASTPTDDAVETEQSPAGADSRETPAIQDECAVVVEPMETQAREDVAAVDAVVTRDILDECSVEVEREEEAALVVSPIPVVEAAPNNEAASTKVSKETAAVEGKRVVAKAIAAPVETEEVAVVDDIHVVVSREIETAVGEDAEREEEDWVVVAATIPAEYVAPAEPTTAAGDSVGAHWQDSPRVRRDHDGACGA